MIAGIGVDLVDIRRFAAHLDRTPALRDRLFTPEERDVAAATLAGTFAVKEALWKALAVPDGLRWHDVTVDRTAGGAPVVRSRGAIQTALAARGVTTTHVSISHDGGFAVALVVLETGP